MDRGVVGSRASTLEALSRYRDTLGHKRQLLMQGGEDLHVWNHLLAAAATEVIRLRHAYVERLRETLVEVLAASDLPFPPIEARYRPSPTNGLEGADAILANFERIADRERRRQLPLVGPHRDDLEILWGGHDIRRVASATRSWMSRPRVTGGSVHAESPEWMPASSMCSMMPPTYSSVPSYSASMSISSASSRSPARPAPGW